MTLPGLNRWEVEALAEIKQWALDHYEEGGDVIVEAFTDEEIREEFIDPVADRVEAVDLARAFCELRESVRRDIIEAGR